MKRTIVLLSLILTGLSLFCQVTPEMYLARIPTFRGDPCSLTDADTASVNQFHRDMGVFFDSLGNDLDRRIEAMDNFMEKNKDQIMQNSLQQAGYSKEDAQKLKNADKMSEEEKMAIANKMLMDKMGMDIGDFKKLAEMDTAAQKNWAQGYGTMMMADAMANPQKSQDDQKRIKDQFDLLNEQQFLVEKIMAAESKYIQQYDTLQAKADKAHAEMMRVFNEFYEQLKDCQNDGCANAIYEEMNNMKKGYCYHFTPQYKGITESYGRYVNSSLKDYYDLDVVANKVIESQTGIRNPEFQPGARALAIIRDYAGKEASVFKFYMAETIFIGGEDGGTSE